VPLFFTVIVNVLWSVPVWVTAGHSLLIITPGVRHRKVAMSNALEFTVVVRTLQMQFTVAVSASWLARVSLHARRYRCPSSSSHPRSYPGR